MSDSDLLKACKAALAKLCGDGQDGNRPSRDGE